MAKSQSVSTFLKTSGGNLPALSAKEMAASIADALDEGTSGGGDKQFLSFSGKLGVYMLGQKRVDVDPDDLYIVEPQSFFGGWTCWKDSKVPGRHYWSIYGDKAERIQKHELEDHGPYDPNSGDGWKQTLGFSCMDAALADGKQIEFSTTSPSGRNSAGDMFREVMDRMGNDEPYIPIIRFEKETFIAQGKKNFKPVFYPESWVSREAVEAFMADKLSIDDLIAGKEPRKPRRKKAA